jgi:rod shape-determining protein MreC
VQQVYLPDFFWRHRGVILFLALLGLSSLIMIDSLRRRSVARVSNELLQRTTLPVQKASEGVRGGTEEVISVMPGLFTARSRNAALRKRVGELEQEVVSLKERLLRERRLEKLIEFTNRTGERRVIARVVGIEPTPWFSTVTVDRGTRDNVHKYMPVLSHSGLAGCVIDANFSTSKVMLLTDSNSKISVVVQRSRARGLVQGDDAGGCVLRYMKTTADVKEGDVLVTSGNSHIYPNGLLVGSVKELRSEPGSLFQWGRVVPATDFEQLEEVAIIDTGAVLSAERAVPTKNN